MARPALTSAAAIVSVIAASSCCLPVVPFLAAVGLAGGSAFLAYARPWLLALSVLLVAFGFYQGIRARQCNRRRAMASRILLWIAAIFVVGSVAFPQTMANATVDLLAGSGGTAPAGQGPLRKVADIAAVRDPFNAAAKEFRMLLFLSPT